MGLYTPYSDSLNVYKLVHRCRKYGLLSREKMSGNMYKYCVSDWGVQYIEEGENFRRDDVLIKLMEYITDGDKEGDKLWAEKVLAPKLLQRFFLGRKVQDIDPLVDLKEAARNAVETLKTRIRDETIIADDEIVNDCLKDVRILYLVRRFFIQMYPEARKLLEFEDLKDRLRYVIWDAMEEMENSKKIHTIHHFETSLDAGRMWAKPADKPNIEVRPNPEDRDKLEKVINKIVEILSTYTDIGL